MNLNRERVANKRFQQKAPPVYGILGLELL
jgi:hypothetical protein